MKKLTDYKLVIWDWNGTLFNDIGACMVSMNILLAEHNLPLIQSEAQFRSIFRFPVIDFYRDLGFDVEHDFSSLANKYVRDYQRECKNSNLQDGAVELLDYLSSHDIKQVIISAAKQEELLEQMQPFHLEEYFIGSYGLSDNLAQSKVELARTFLSTCDYQKEDIVIIGDTTHDSKVAHELGIDCILVDFGNQSKQNLEREGYPIISSFNELKTNTYS